MKILLKGLWIILLVLSGSKLFPQQLINSLSKINAVPVILDSTELPIIFINTYGQLIEDEPKISVDFKIMNKGYNVMNKVTDSYNNYDGQAGIEKRGSISQLWPQNSYSIELQDSLGEELNASLLGMPDEHDWVLYSPYNDLTLMRNALSYQLARELGHWSSHTKFCEVLKQEFTFNPSYHGIYLLTEKIKRDKNRVNISKLNPEDTTGDALTGGYIIAIDKNIWTGDSGFTTKNSPQVFIKYVYPKPKVIMQQQTAYIQNYVDSFETALLKTNFTDPVNGYRKYIDVSSFIDYFIIIEMSKSIDAFRRSAYMYKDKYSKGGKLIAGPYWDFNSAWGKPRKCGFETPDGWAYAMTCYINSKFAVPFWWSRMLQDSTFNNELKCRWNYLRQTSLSLANIFQIIDSMANYISGTDAHLRHFKRWDFTKTFQDQTDSLKLWITQRVAWMDANMPGNCTISGAAHNIPPYNVLTVYPNPAKDGLNILINDYVKEDFSVQLIDMFGRIVMKYSGEKYTKDKISLSIPLSNLSSGIYYLRLSSKNLDITKNIIITK